MFCGVATPCAIRENVIVRILALRSQPVGEQPRSQMLGTNRIKGKGKSGPLTNILIPVFMK